MTILAKRVEEAQKKRDEIKASIEAEEERLRALRVQLTDACRKAAHLERLAALSGQTMRYKYGFGPAIRNDRDRFSQDCRTAFRQLKERGVIPPNSEFLEAEEISSGGGTFHEWSVSMEMRYIIPR